MKKQIIIYPHYSKELVSLLFETYNVIYSNDYSSIETDRGRERV